MDFEVWHKGHRYWAHLLSSRHRWKWNFWSDHRWPFYHGSFTQDRYDRDEALKAFHDWLPFEMET